MLKKIIALALCALMAVTCAIPAFAEDTAVTDCCDGLVPGDANSDGKVDFKDTSRIIRHCAGYHDEIHSDNADVRNDGEITMKDVSLIIKFLAGWQDVRLGHLDEATVVTAPNCTDEGIEQVACTICKNVKAESPIEPLGHDLAEGVCSRCDFVSPVADFYKVNRWLKENDEFAALGEELGEDFGSVYGIVFEYEVSEDETSGTLSAVMGIDINAELGDDIIPEDFASEAISFVNTTADETNMKMLLFIASPELILSEDEEMHGVVINYMNMNEEEYVFAQGICGEGYEAPKLIGSKMDATSEDFAEIELTEEELSVLGEEINVSLSEMLDALSAQYKESTGEDFDPAWLGFAA